MYHAGMAVELATKTALAARNPVLLDNARANKHDLRWLAESTGAFLNEWAATARDRYGEVVLWMGRYHVALSSTRHARAMRQGPEHYRMVP